MNNKRDRFERVAVARTNKIIKTLRLLSNCADRNNYDYNEKDINKIFNAIENELKKTKAKFNKNEESTKFTL